MAGRISACLVAGLILCCSGSSWAQIPSGMASGISAAYPDSAFSGGAYHQEAQGWDGQGFGHPMANQYYTTNPDDSAWDYDDDSPLDRKLRQVFKNSWFRADYMLTRFENPGDELLGAPIQGIENPREPFVATNNAVLGTARVPSLSNMNLIDNNGVRLTFGIETLKGSIEGNWFDINESDRSIAATELPVPNLPNLQTWVATSVLINGEITNVNNLFIYDQSYNARLTSNFRGLELIFVKGPKANVDGLTFQPLFGFQYRRFQERLTQTGVFFDTTTNANLVSVIDSEAKNHILSPEIGLRVEIERPWFTAGVEPKLVLGVNQYETTVATNNLRSFADPATADTEDSTKFSPAFEMNVYGRFRVTDRLSFHIAYNLFYYNKLTRPYDNIFYNDPGAGLPLGIRNQTTFEPFTVDALSLGGEYRF